MDTGNEACSWLKRWARGRGKDKDKNVSYLCHENTWEKRKQENTAKKKYRIEFNCKLDFILGLHGAIIGI